MIYILCKRLIAMGNMDENKLRVFHEDGQLTDEQLAELSALLAAA